VRYPRIGLLKRGVRVLYDTGRTSGYEVAELRIGSRRSSAGRRDVLRPRRPERAVRGGRHRPDDGSVHRLAGRVRRAGVSASAWEQQLLRVRPVVQRAGADRCDRYADHCVPLRRRCVLHRFADLGLRDGRGIRWTVAVGAKRLPVCWRSGLLPGQR
jgi:hypothetical protein